MTARLLEDDVDEPEELERIDEVDKNDELDERLELGEGDELGLVVSAEVLEIGVLELMELELDPAVDVTIRVDESATCSYNCSSPTPPQYDELSPPHTTSEAPD